MDLVHSLQSERDAAFRRLRGGYPIVVAGAIWWAVMAGLGFAGVSLQRWIFCAAAGSGLLFPLAILLSKLFRSQFLSDRTAVSDVLFPAFLAMLLFWPMAISAWWNYPELVPLIIGIGMSLHWPVIGWSYARTALYSAHAVVRALACFFIWNFIPSGRLDLMPMVIAAIYVVTALVILVQTRRSSNASATT